jgi:hypothetical protein
MIPSNEPTNPAPNMVTERAIMYLVLAGKIKKYFLMRLNDAYHTRMLKFLNKDWRYDKMLWSLLLLRLIL